MSKPRAAAGEVDLPRVNTNQAGEEHAAAHVTAPEGWHQPDPRVRGAACSCTERHGLQRPPLHNPLSSSSSMLMRDLREASWRMQKLQDSSWRGARLEGFQILFCSSRRVIVGQLFYKDQPMQQMPLWKALGRQRPGRGRLGLPLLVMQKSAPLRAVPV